jgi:hypothetical protein
MDPIFNEGMYARIDVLLHHNKRELIRTCMTEKDRAYLVKAMSAAEASYHDVSQGQTGKKPKFDARGIENYTVYLILNNNIADDSEEAREIHSKATDLYLREYGESAE